MKQYYVNDNAQANGDHEVHRDDCQYQPSCDGDGYLVSSVPTLEFMRQEGYCD